ncbi:MAG TPA: response regulator [Longimicrobiaceae bacterium]
MLFASAWDHANRPSRRGDDSPTVLLVGEAHCRAIFRSILSGRGYEIFDASGPREALPLARQLDPDLVMVDIGMAGACGWDAVRNFKSNADTYLIPLLAVSLAPQPAGTYRRARSAGFVDYISRPIERRHVLEVVSVWTRPPQRASN